MIGNCYRIKLDLEVEGHYFTQGTEGFMYGSTREEYPDIKLYFAVHGDAVDVTKYQHIFEEIFEEVTI